MKFGVVIRSKQESKHRSLPSSTRIERHFDPIDPIFQLHQMLGNQGVLSLLQSEGIGSIGAKKHGTPVAEPKYSDSNTITPAYGSVLQGGLQWTQDRRRAAKQGISGSTSSLPYLERIQPLFGHHDVGQIRAHLGIAAEAANERLQARAYTIGNHAAFRGRPSLRTAAHEAAHVVQQRNGAHLRDMAQPDNIYERYADAIAERVVQNRPATDLLDKMNPDPAVSDAGSVQTIQFQEIEQQQQSDISAQGEEAEQSQLEQDMRDTLQDWSIGCRDGIHLFVHQTLERQINQLSRGSLSSFLLMFAGSTIWAAAAFVPEGMAVAAFAVSMTGVSIGLSPSVASLARDDDTALTQVEEILVEKLNEIYRELNRSLPDKAQTLLQEYPGVSRYRALWLFISESFGRDAATAPNGYIERPMVLQEKLRDRWRDTAEDAIERFRVQVEPIGSRQQQSVGGGGGSAGWVTETKAAWITRGRERKLALVEETWGSAAGIGGAGTWHYYEFVRWIDPDMEAPAIERMGGSIPELTEADEIRSLP